MVSAGVNEFIIPNYKQTAGITRLQIRGRETLDLQSTGPSPDFFVPLPKTCRALRRVTQVSKRMQ